MNWKTMVVLGSLLWLMLSCFADSVNKTRAEEITTNNLISQDFTDGSWNNPVNSWHSSNDLAGWNGMEHTTSVTYTPDTEALKQNGFQMNAGGEIFHWYNGQTVHVTQSVTLDTGTVFEQTKSYTASRGTTHDVSNTIIINSNTSASYDLGMGILFEDTRGQVGHYSADFRDPFITLTYDNTVVQVEQNVTEQINNDLNLIQDSFSSFEVLNIVETKEIKTETFAEPMLDNFSEDKVMKDSFNSYKEEVAVQTLEESKEIKQEVKQEIKEEVKQEIKEEIKQEVKQEVTKEEEKKTATVINNEEEKESNSKTTTASSVSTKESKEPKDIQSKKVKTKTVSLKAKLNNVDVNVKDVSKNLELKNLIKLNAILNDEVSLSTYTNAVFYKSKEIYSNQDLMLDNRLLYANVTLDVYVANDPLVIKQQKLNKIKYEKQKLILQIQELRNE